MKTFQSSLTVKTIDADQRILEGWATTPTPDRSMDVVLPEGAEFDLVRTPVPLLLDHDHRQACGTVEAAEVTKRGIRFRARIPKLQESGAAKEISDAAWSLLRAGLRRSCSIGFLPIEAEPRQGGGWLYRSWQWLELSLVAVPCQPEAQITTLKRAPRQRRSTVRVPNGLPIVNVDPAPRVTLPVVKLPGHEIVARKAGDSEYERRTGEKVPQSPAARAEWIRAKQISARVRGVAWASPDDIAEALRKAGKLPEPARAYHFPDLALARGGKP